MPEDTRNAEAVGTAAAAVGFLNQAEALMAGFRLQPHIDQDAMHAAFDKLYDLLDGDLGESTPSPYRTEDDERRQYGA